MITISILKFVFIIILTSVVAKYTGEYIWKKFLHGEIDMSTH